MEIVDIFITTFLRQEFAKECIKYLTERTNSPYRLWIIDNGGNEWAEKDSRVYRYIPLFRSLGNTGIHFAWNVALSLATSSYFITSDPDLLVPDLTPDWLFQLYSFINNRPDYAAISLHPHIFIGTSGIDPNDKEDVKERNMAGAVFRIMRREVIEQVGGWEHKIEEGRNHEERTICSKVQAVGYKVGITSRIRAYHLFGENWGYPEEFTPERQKHNSELKDYVKQFDQITAYDPATWLPK